MRLTSKQRDVLRCLDEEFDGGQATLCLLSDALAKRDAEHDWVGWDSGGLYTTLQRLGVRGLVIQVRERDGSYWQISSAGESAWREAAEAGMSRRAEERTMAALGRLRALRD